MNIIEQKVNAARHGEANYAQGKILKIADADDLTEKGKQDVIKNAGILAADIKPDEKAVIWSSPFGRTLQTAKLIVETLKEKGVNIKEKKGKAEDELDKAIRVFEQFEEVRDFNLEYFRAFLNGGKIQFEGKEVTLDPKVTNPNNLTFPQYHNQRAWTNVMSPDIPVELMNTMNKIETEKDSNERMSRILGLIKKYNPL